MLTACSHALALVHVSSIVSRHSNSKSRVRPTLLSLRAATNPGEPSADQLEKALAFQLKQAAASGAVSSRKAEVDTKPAQANVSVVADIEARQAAARAWVGTYLEKRKQAESKSLQVDLQQRLPLLQPEQVQAGLARQLGVSDQPEMPEAPGNGDARSRFEPFASYEDGSVMYTLEMLAAVDYEDILAP